jgi:glycosyltransferase involved in cell wall biosynthesis
VGCVGNIRPVKGHKSLIEAARIVFQEFPDTHFVLVGGGKWRKDLMKTCKHLGLASNIHFPGMRQDVPKLLDCMDICVLPSLSEGFSNTLLEYMAAGKPIVATRVGGNPEVIIHEKNGLLANKEDPNDLAENILFLLSDEEAAERMGVQARKDVENQFALERMVERYQVLFKDLTRDGHKDDIS